MKKTLIVFLVLLLLLMTACGNIDEGEKNPELEYEPKEGEVVFSFSDGEEVDINRSLPAEYSGYMCSIVPCMDDSLCYAVLTHASSSGNSEDEIVILSYDSKNDKFSELYRESCASCVVQRCACAGTGLYALIKNGETGITELCTFENGEKKVLTEYPEGEFETISCGSSFLPIYRYTNEDIWLELYHPEDGTFEKGIGGLSSFSQYENPCLSRWGWTAVVRGKEAPYITLIPAQNSGQSNPAAFPFDLGGDLLPARIRVSEKYIVFTDGYDKNPDIYMINIEQLTGETVTAASKDIPVKKIVVPGKELDVFSMNLCKDKLYILDAPDNLYVMDLTASTVTSHKLSEQIWGMSDPSLYNLTLFNTDSGAFSVIPF